MIPPATEQARKGLGGYGFIAVMLLIVGLLLSISISNNITYQLRKNSNSLTLWKGKFAPRGYQLVEEFQPVEVGDADVSALTGRKFTGKDAVNRAIFAFFMDQVNGETAQGNGADLGKMNVLLNRAEAFAEINGAGEASLKSMRFQLAQQRVGMAELGLHKTYRKALPIYQEALKAGLGDAATLEAKVEAMQEALGLVSVVAPEAPEEQAEVAPAKEEASKEAAITAPPETVAKEAQTPAATEESATEEEAAVAPAAGAEETQVPAEVESSTEEGEAVPADTADTETDATVEQTNPGEETENPTSFMQWLKSKQQ
jgi:hypothetical protein